MRKQITFTCEVCGQEHTIGLSSYKRKEQPNRCKPCATRANGRANKKHGMKDHPLYQVYVNMMQRCYNPESSKYPEWGGRGVEVCSEWRASREAFFEWAKPLWQRGLSLERVDNDGPYSPENCVFADWHTQQKNRRDSLKNQLGDRYEKALELIRSGVSRPDVAKQVGITYWQARALESHV